MEKLMIQWVNQNWLYFSFILIPEHGTVDTIFLLRQLDLYNRLQKYLKPSYSKYHF